MRNFVDYKLRSCDIFFVITDKNENMPNRGQQQKSAGSQVFCNDLSKIHKRGLPEGPYFMYISFNVIYTAATGINQDALFSQT